MKKPSTINDHNSESHLRDVRRTWRQAKCLYDQARVERAISDVGHAIAVDYAELNPILLVMMRGGVVFAGQLATLLPFPLEIDYLHASRYGEGASGGELVWTFKPEVSAFKGRHILIVDDIFDEGQTLHHTAQWFRENDCASVEAAVLVTKEHARQAYTFRPKYSGMVVPDVFVVGYGMDYRGHFRNANGLFQIEPHD